MFFTNDTESNEYADVADNNPLVLDGTVNLEDGEEDSIPRVRGLVELISDYLGD